MQGVPGYPAEGRWSACPGRQPLSVPIGSWSSGLYFARLRQPTAAWGSHRSSWRPRRIGVHPVAVVVPTLTWQAYNFRDDDGDGNGRLLVRRGSDSTRCGSVERTSTVACRMGFAYHLGFLKWLHWTASGSTSSRNGTSSTVREPSRARRAYDLIVFAGHHEYVTTREYDLVERYRDLGGNLMFLSREQLLLAGRATRRHHREVQALARPRPARGRAHRRPVHRLPAIAAATVGRATDAGAAHGSSTGTGLRPGSPFGRGGVEIDQVTQAHRRTSRCSLRSRTSSGPGRRRR